MILRKGIMINIEIIKYMKHQINDQNVVLNDFSTLYKARAFHYIVAPSMFLGENKISKISCIYIFQTCKTKNL